MIYLKNNTILQELYIPRQDYISNTTGSSGTYAEGYADGYESGYTSGSTDGFDSGYTEGYSSGETHQKGLLTSTGITKNGEYQREDGWSAITVNVSGSVLEGKEIVVSEDITVVTPDSGYDGFSAVTVDATEYGQANYDSGFDDGYTDGYSSGSSEGYDSGYTEGYQSGSTDGYNSGYTSGETHQKSLLVSTAITENGSYQREDGYSAITVNVPTGTSYNIEENKQFTANTNGSYSIKPSVYTTVNDSFENGVYRISFEHSGYPTNDVISVLRVEDFSDPTKGYVDISIVRGQSSYYIGVWSGGTVYRESLTPLTLRFENANEHYGWVKNVGYIENYDLMSAVTLDVNVPVPNIETNKEFTATTNGYYWVAPSSGSVSINDRFDSDDDCYYITATTSGYPLGGRYNLFYIEDEFDSSKGQIDVYIDNGYLDYDDSWWEGGRIMDYETGDILRLKVYDANNGFGWTRDDDYNLKYDAMNGLGVVVEVPQTGHTDQELQDAYDSGYTSGENNVISTFTATTATTNGIYGSSAHPLSSITVNVPQSGGGVRYVEYIETDNTQIGWDTGYNIGNDIDARIYIDFMPLSGSGYGDYWFAYYGDGEEYVLFRRAGNNSPIGFMFGNNQSVKDRSSYSVTNGNRYLISLDKYGITDEDTGTLLESVNSSYINSTNNLWLNCDGNPQEVSRCIPARYYGFRVENGNGETVLDMRPCLDGNDVPCFYDEVSQTYIYHQGSGTPVAGSVLPSPEYQSGYTDGYNEAISDVIDSAETLTVTANGSYSTALIADGHLWNEVVVNVPIPNIEENKGFAATSNGNYTITPSSGSTTMRREYDDGVDWFFTASTYPSVGYFDIGTIVMEISGGSIINIPVFYNDGEIGFDGSDWNYGIYTGQTNKDTLYVGFDSEDYSSSNFVSGSDFTIEYSAMSAVTLSVNVPQSGANGESLLFDSDINNQVDVYTDTTNKYYFGNGYKTIVRFHKDNSGYTQSGVSWCGASDLGDNGYSENGFSIGAQSFVVNNNGLSSVVRFTQSPKANGWENAEVGLSYSGNVCNYYLSYNGEIFISSSYTRSTTVENHYGLRVGVGNGRGLFGFESLKTYDNNNNLIGYVVYNPLTNMLMDLLDNTITFSPSAGTVSDLSGQYL